MMPQLVQHSALTIERRRWPPQGTSSVEEQSQMESIKTLYCNITPCSTPESKIRSYNLTVGRNSPAGRIVPDNTLILSYTSM